uniref:Thioredoxin n=1 Tax=Candidatus Caldatribacterium californiense TaxID=1454726 RepID=A0A7V4DG97_9BACT
MGENILELNEANFEEEVLRAQEPVLVDFWATWCMPCRMMAPVVEDIAKSFSGRIKVGKVNTDEVPSLALRYGVHAIPTLIFFQDGREIERVVGYVPRRLLEEKLKRILGEV